MKIFHNNEKNTLLTSMATLLVLILFSNKSYSIDVVKLHRQEITDNKAAHHIEVVGRALEITEPEYGPFKLKVVNLTMSAGRLLKASNEGKIFNTAVMPASRVWDEHIIAIKVPVRLGLLSYRILLINKVDLSKFEKVNSLDDLNHFTSGVITDWVTTEIFELSKIKMVKTGHFEGIFLMLDKHRFDYIPRGIYEIYDELEERQSVLKDIVVEPAIALHIPTSTYVYVSPNETRLAKRLTIGLNELFASGELKTILYKYYSNYIERANLAERKIIEIANPYHDKNEKPLFYIQESEVTPQLPQ